MMKYLRYLTCFLGLCVYQLPAQQITPDTVQAPHSSLRKGRALLVSGTNTALYLSGISYLNYVWYKNDQRVHLHFYNDLPGWKQMDKMGHMYSSRFLAQVSYETIKWAGASKKQALLYSGVSAMMYMTPIEVLDGLYQGYGFSWSDMGANTLGMGLFVGQQALWDEQRIWMKFSYSPSGYPKYHPFYLGASPAESFFLDYNAHTYWLSGNIRSLTPWKKAPSWLNLALGYSANGMLAEFKNPLTYRGTPIPPLDRYRQFLLSPDIDWQRIPTQKKWLKKVFFVMNYLKTPAPALEYNAIQGFRWHWLYY